MAEFGRVEVKSIKAAEPRANFSEAQLDQLADLILKGEGVLRPVIVKQIDYENYTLIDGALTYYAAVRAREKDSRRGEMVNAFIIKPKEDEALARQQIEALNGAEPSRNTSGNAESTTTTNATVGQNRPGEWITSFELRLSDTRNEVTTKTRDLEYRLSQLEKAIDASVRYSDLLELINTLDKDELVARLTFYGADSAKAKAIVQARMSKPNGKFTSYADLIDSTKNLAEKGLLKLLDNFRTHTR